MMRKTAGFTLLELLVALLIMAVLGIMSWRALDAALNSRDRILSVEHRWERLARGFALIENNLMQVAQRKDPSPKAQADFKLEKLEDGNQRIYFWRSDAQQGARLSGFRVEQNQLMLLRWPHNVPSPDPDAELILDGVSNLRWAVLDSSHNWQETWPPTQTSALPLGIRLDLDIENVGHIQRLFALH
ncbi:type II secretion system minor pseudopilin GspJ [Uliginosibacterium sediminicola]|uniref:Type II secretion system protein J n=1 Tax=Uliginosibacterium sediminicola TaxID=2024550 RepID=A0ABU9Z2S9_9RHOO